MATAFFRTVILYLALIVVLRLTGKRQIGELEPNELVLTMLMSDLAAVPMQDFGIPLLSGLLPIAVLLCLSLLMSWLNLRSIRFRTLLCGKPAVIIRHGKLQQQAMRRNRLTLDELLEELRCQGVTDLTTVKYAVLETSGQVTVLLYPCQQPMTPRQAGVAVTDDLSLPTVLINDGRLLRQNLHGAGYEEKWLQKQLRAAGASRVEEIFLLTVDESGGVVCILKEGTA